LFLENQIDDFKPDSDIDKLIELEPGTKVGFIKMTRVENELFK
jgi:predicted nucleotidyltransferase